MVHAPSELSTGALAERAGRAREVVRRRHEQFFGLERTSGRDGWPPEHDQRFDDLAPGAMPEIERSELTADALAAGVLGRGSLLVRNLFSIDAADMLVADTDRALDAARRWLEGAPADAIAPWFELFVPSPPYSVGLSRQFVVDGGGVLAADSPLAMCTVIELLEQAGVRSVLTEYFGERPVLSAKKTTLRRVPPDSGSDWHQDGAFLGRDTRAVNVWVALSACGLDAPGLDVVAQRIDLVETGTEGAIFPWSVGRPVVDRVAGDRGIVRPVFAAGDALLFDERNLHATACGAAMSRDRYALEAWFFAPSHFPEDQVPIVF